MDNEKMIFNLSEGCNEVIIREGSAPAILPELAPKKVNISGSIGSVAEWLGKRINTGQFEQQNCHIIVNRDEVTIALIMNETDPYKCDYIIGKMEYHPAFIKYGINTGKMWSPIDLSMHIKMTRAYFEDKDNNMLLVSTLKNYKADITTKVEKDYGDNGNRTDNFQQTVNSNLPPKFTLLMPIFKGGNKERIEVETFASVDGRDITFMLVSAGAQETLDDTRDKIIDEQLTIIRDIAPQIAIIEE